MGSGCLVTARLELAEIRPGFVSLPTSARLVYGLQREKARLNRTLSTFWRGYLQVVVRLTQNDAAPPELSGAQAKQSYPPSTG